MPADLIEPANATGARTGKYLTFHIVNEEFAIPVLKVREIIGVQDITAVPRTPAFVKGVINLRGKVIPVVDLRLKFGLPEAQYTQLTCIIVVQVSMEMRDLLVGIVVDGVSDVLNLAGSDIEDTPNFGHGVAVPYLLGMAKTKDGLKILLDIDALLCGNTRLTVLPRGIEQSLCAGGAQPPCQGLCVLEAVLP
jgi:purine-binding chemotaxis protein CheW